MVPYRRILVPLDNSGADRAILQHVAALATAFKAEVVLLRVAHFHLRDEMTHEVEEAEEVVDETAAGLREAGFPVRVVVGKGEIADDIVTQAELLDCDLIAMGTHGHGALKRAVLGSVAEKVRHATSVPLLLVKASAAADRSSPPAAGGSAAGSTDASGQG